MFSPLLFSTPDTLQGEELWNREEQGWQFLNAWNCRNLLLGKAREQGRSRSHAARCFGQRRICWSHPYAGVAEPAGAALLSGGALETLSLPRYSSRHPLRLLVEKTRLELYWLFSSALSNGVWSVPLLVINDPNNSVCLLEWKESK